MTKTSTENILKIVTSVAIIASLGIWRSFHQKEQRLSHCRTDGNQSNMDDTSPDLTLLDPKSGLSKGTIQEIRRIYQLQKEEKIMCGGAGWDFWNERVHIEKLFCTRFNYLILCYSLFLAAYATLNGKISKIAVLGVGFVVLCIMSIFLKRAWEKLDILLKIIYNLHPHGANGLLLIDDLVDKKASFRLIKKYNEMAGVWLPRFLCISFLLGILAIIFGWGKIIESYLP